MPKTEPARPVESVTGTLTGRVLARCTRRQRRLRIPKSVTRASDTLSCGSGRILTLPIWKGARFAKSVNFCKRRADTLSSGPLWRHRKLPFPRLGGPPYAGCFDAESLTSAHVAALGDPDLLDRFPYWTLVLRFVRQKLFEQLPRYFPGAARPFVRLGAENVGGRQR